MNRKIFTKQFFSVIMAVIALAAVSGGGAMFYKYFFAPPITGEAEDLRLDDQEATVRAIRKVLPSVVSIIVYDVENYAVVSVPPFGESEVRKEKIQKSRGTGFIITADGYIVTNRHVVEAAKEKTAEYRVILNSGQEYYAQMIARDQVNDLAVLKIFDKDLPAVELGDSDRLAIGTTVIAIGNALGRYQNSATKGIVSGLGRSLTVNEYTGNPEYLDSVIQTDAEINVGNSGGPLIDLEGRVVGINTAIEMTGTAIGFAIPVNDARPVIKSIREKGVIIRPRLGVLYRMITPEIALDEGLPRQSGAWIVEGTEESPSVVPEGPADRAGLKAGDIIFEINAIKIEGRNTLLSVVQKYRPGDKIGLKVRRGDKVLIFVATLDEMR